ncbi:MAG: hypothetical protein ACLFWI_18865 [Coleofasciculus sp.]|uniref:hypothetical protein n=1 Tax=Coleofasciculus sp. TaxID=3100458 RepID=UPI003A3F05C4
MIGWVELRLCDRVSPVSPRTFRRLLMRRAIALPPPIRQIPNPTAFQVSVKVAIAFPSPDLTISENENLRSLLT